MRRRKNSDTVRYLAYVMWLNGSSLSSVAAQVTAATGEAYLSAHVWKIIQRSPYRKRSDMSQNERQNHLDILAGERLDGGKLKASAFIARPMSDRRKTRG